VYKAVSGRHDPEQVLQRLGCYAPDTKGSGTSTVLAGLYLSCVFAGSPREAVLYAVNALGTDTDSIAAFVGGISGALHGVHAVPVNWQSVQDASYLDHTARRLLAISECRLTEEEEPSPQLANEKAPHLSQKGFDSIETGQRVYLRSIGLGQVQYVTRQPTPTGGKHTVVTEVAFDLGQSCVFSSRFDGELLEPESSGTHHIEKLTGSVDARLVRIRRLAEDLKSGEVLDSVSALFEKTGETSLIEALNVIETLLITIQQREAVTMTEEKGN
jgi:hypothetical protein